MSNTGKQSPLGVNVMSGLIQGKGFWINKPAAGYMGSFTPTYPYPTEAPYDNYTYTNGSISALNKLTDAIQAGWALYTAVPPQITDTTYFNLINIGKTTIPALGNTKPPDYTYNDEILGPNWVAPYEDEADRDKNTSYGFVGLYALQAYKEFNYNNTLYYKQNVTNYTDFVGSWSEASSFIDYSNQSVMAMQNSFNFLNGTYSNMNDLITGDITGISLSPNVFGQDLIALGKAINLNKIRTFGFPSNVLETLKTYNALTESVVLALLAWLSSIL
jgi:hypothetical protein